MNDEMTLALTQLRARATSYELHTQYYEGVHRLAFATEKFRNAFGSLFRAFADNLCPAVVDAVVERLIVEGFDVDTGGESLSAEAWAIWQRNRMDQRARQVHAEALRAGDAYVIVWPDDQGQPTLYPNRGAAMTVGYAQEQPGLIEWAAKAWTLPLPDGRVRLNMYYPDRIEKYVTISKTDWLPEKPEALVVYEVAGEPWPVPNPWQVVPVFHFANNAVLGDFGASELRDVLPLQDALNKAVTDMLVAMEYVALPQRWVTGIEVQIDESTGKPLAPFVPGFDRVWSVGAPDATFGQFDPANLAQFIQVQDGFRAEIARVSGTPLHYMMLQSGDFPSGEAMRTAEARFLAKVTDRQVSFGNVWEDALALALRMAGNAEVQLSARWKDPTPRAEKEQVEIAVLKQQLGVSETQTLLELGYTPEQVATMQQERAARDQQLGERLLTTFEHGEEVDGEDEQA